MASGRVVSRGPGCRPGFTLLEAAVALTIVGLVTIGAFGAFGAQLRADARASEVTPAAALARDRMAALDLLAELGERPLPDSLAQGIFDPPFDAYRWTASVKPAGSSMREPGLYDVHVTVSWPTGEYALRTRRFRDPARWNPLISRDAGR